MTAGPVAVLQLGTHKIPAGGFTPIGWQAYEIITSILEDPSPGLAEVKGRLLQCLAAHPDSPEQALVAHLMATSTAANDHGGESQWDGPGHG